MGYSFMLPMWMVGLLLSFISMTIMGKYKTRSRTITFRMVYRGARNSHCTYQLYTQRSKLWEQLGGSLLMVKVVYSFGMRIADQQVFT